MLSLTYWIDLVILNGKGCPIGCGLHGYSPVSFLL